MTRRRSIIDAPLPPEVQVQPNAAGQQVAAHIRQHMSQEVQDSLNRVGQAFLERIREDWDVVEKIDAARTHRDPAVRTVWELPDRYDFSLEDAAQFSRGQAIDPRKRFGRPKGKQAADAKEPLRQKLFERLGLGDKQSDVVNDLAPNWPANSLEAAKAALRAEIRDRTKKK